MNLFLRHLGFVSLGLLLGSCDRHDEETGGEGIGKEAMATSSSRTVSLSGEGPRRKSRPDQVTAVLAKLRGMTNKDLKRDFFEEMILELPPEDHDLAVEAVIDDLNSGDPANLVVEYLELNSLMSPALQLPGMVRLLDEESLLPLQRVAMEQQLREDLEIAADLTVKNWRPLVEAHLKKDKSLIPE